MCSCIYVAIKNEAKTFLLSRVCHNSSVTEKKAVWNVTIFLKSTSVIQENTVKVITNFAQHTVCQLNANKTLGKRPGHFSKKLLK